MTPTTPSSSTPSSTPVQYSWPLDAAKESDWKEEEKGIGLEDKDQMSQKSRKPPMHIQLDRKKQARLKAACARVGGLDCFSAICSLPSAMKSKEDFPPSDVAPHNIPDEDKTVAVKRDIRPPIHGQDADALTISIDTALYRNYVVERNRAFPGQHHQSRYRTELVTVSLYAPLVDLVKAAMMVTTPLEVSEFLKIATAKTVSESLSYRWQSEEKVKHINYVPLVLLKDPDLISRCIRYAVSKENQELYFGTLNQQTYGECSIEDLTSDPNPTNWLLFLCLIIAYIGKARLFGCTQDWFQPRVPMSLIKADSIHYQPTAAINCAVVFFCWVIGLHWVVKARSEGLIFTAYAIAHAVPVWHFIETFEYHTTIATINNCLRETYNLYFLLYLVRVFVMLVLCANQLMARSPISLKRRKRAYRNLLLMLIIFSVVGSFETDERHPTYESYSMVSWGTNTIEMCRGLFKTYYEQNRESPTFYHADFVSFNWCRMVGIELNPGPAITTTNCVDAFIPSIDAQSMKDSAWLIDLNRPEKPSRQCQQQHCFDSDQYRPNVFNNTKHNQLSALIARVLKKTPDVDKEFMKAFVDFVKDNADKLLPGCTKIKLRPMDIEEWVRGVNCSEAVRKKLRLAIERLSNMGYTCDSYIPRGFRRKWTRRKSFVKVENNLYNSPCGELEKGARLIQGAQEEFSVLVGPFIASLQGYVKRIWDGRGAYMFTSGQSMSAVATYISGAGNAYQIVEDDVSAWDASISPELCELECWIAEQFGAPRAVIQLMRDNINTRGATQHFKYGVAGTRKSGDPYTSLMNSIINGLTHTYIYHLHQQRVRGWSLSQSLQSIRMVLQGDDNTLAGLNMHEVDFAGGMLKLGFKAQALRRVSWEDTEFCSCYFHETSEGPVFVPKPGRLLMKSAYSINLPQNFDSSAYIRGVSDCIDWLFPDDRLMQAVVRAYRRISGNVKPMRFRDEPWRMQGQIAGQLDALYCRVYGIASADIADLVRKLDGMRQGDLWPNLLRYLMFDRDTGAEHLIQVTQGRVAPGLTNQRLPVQKRNLKSPNEAKHNIVNKTQQLTYAEIVQMMAWISTSKRSNQPALKQRTKIGRSAPPRDLTRYGIEPNPGPTPKIKKELKKEVKKDAKQTFKKLAREGVKHVTSSNQGKPSMARSALRAGAGMLGGLVGLRGPAEAASDFISDVFGFGAYHVKRNSLATCSNQVPEFKADNEGRVRFQHRELIQDVVGSTAFNNSYVGQITPTNHAMFPWLAKIASNYEEYKFHGLLFMFKSTSADALNSTNTALGTVLMATQYDAADAAFNDKQTLEAYEFATSCKPSTSAIHPVECAPSADVITKRYVRGVMNSQNQGLPITTSLANTVRYSQSSLQSNANFTDVGVFQLSTVGMQAAATIGELWVIYDVELLMPRLTPQTPTPTLAWYSNNPNGVPIATGGTIFTNTQNLTEFSNNTLGQTGYPQVGSSPSFSYIGFPGCQPRSVWNVHIVGVSVGSATVTQPSASFFNCTQQGTCFPTTTGIGNAGFWLATSAGFCWQFTVALNDDTSSSIPLVTIPPLTITGGGSVYVDVRFYRQPYIFGNGRTQLNMTLEEEQAERIKAMVLGQVTARQPFPDPPCGPPEPIGPSPPGPPMPNIVMPTIDEVKETETPFEDLESSVHIQPQQLQTLKSVLGGLIK